MCWCATNRSSKQHNKSTNQPIWIRRTFRWWTVDNIIQVSKISNISVMSSSSRSGSNQSGNNPNQNNGAGSSDDSFSWAYLALEVAKFAVTIGVSYYLTREALSMLKGALEQTSNKPSAKQAVASKKALAKRLKRPEVETIEFTDYELRLLPDVLGSDEIEVSFEDIGGLESQLEEVKDNVVLPIQLFHHGKSSKGLRGLTSCPTGVLLYGRPGTGKSLMAKAIARETGCTFLNIKASSLTDKWFGESDHLVSALFALGRKLAPSIVFIDEIETLLKKRGSDYANPALHSMQGVFLSEWDGLGALNNVDPNNPFSEKDAPVIIMGATNRPLDLDAAFLRRMPVHIKTEMPDVKARLSILKAQLKKEELGDNVDLDQLARDTEQYTGSDIRELVRVAVLQRAKDVTLACREAILKTKANTSLNSDAQNGEKLVIDDSTLGSMRPLIASDFAFALKKTRDAVRKTAEFNTEVLEGDLEQRIKSVEMFSKKISGGEK